MKALLLTTVFLLCFSEGYQLNWREDGRCGNEFLLTNGFPAQCNPQEGYPCCSEFGYCGITEEHCNCPTCTDHRIETSPAVCQNIEVSLKNDVLTNQKSLQGIYTLDQTKSWKSATHAIWYNPKYKYWSIGDLENVGSNIRGLTSSGNQSDIDPSGVPKWYYMADDWKCSLCDDTIVKCITGSSQTGRVPGGSSQTGGFVGGVGAPAYLSVSGYELCLDEYTPAGTSHSEFCLPQKRPFSCTENSWNQLQNVFKGDCPQSGVIGANGCVWNGKTYENGDSFKDDCNTCNCNGGQVACTLAICPGEFPILTVTTVNPITECSGTFVNKKGKEKQRPCIFPFKFKGKTYNQCTTDESENGKPRCAYKVNKQGKIANGKWAECEPGCPGTEVDSETISY